MESGSLCRLKPQVVAVLVWRVHGASQDRGPPPGTARRGLGTSPPQADRVGVHQWQGRPPPPDGSLGDDWRKGTPASIARISGPSNASNGRPTRPRGKTRQTAGGSVRRPASGGFETPYAQFVPRSRQGTARWPSFRAIFSTARSAPRTLALAGSRSSQTTSVA
jgi:hypothetical protein